MTHLLILEGNTRARQKVARDLGMRTSSGIYKKTINAIDPGIGTEVIIAAEGLQGLPAGVSLQDFDGLVIGGSGLRCADTTPEVTAQIEVLRQFAKLGRPILGSCWGLQIAVVAAGGTVRPSPNGREIVVARKLALTDAGKSHALFAGKPTVFDAPCTHYDEIASLPSGATLLCSNAHSEVQAAIVPLENTDVWGVQYHPEFDVRHLADLLRLYGDATITDGFFRDASERDAYQRRLSALAADPNDAALAWQLGIDSDVLDAGMRSLEIRNWIERSGLS